MYVIYVLCKVLVVPNSSWETGTSDETEKTVLESKTLCTTFQIQILCIDVRYGCRSFAHGIYVHLYV